ncbi:MAG TPA: toxin-antitoxin system HicB family antitoxin [Allosphingosinicella sp.]|jgi:hypothetical protein
MNKPASFPLRLPQSIKSGAQRLAARDGISLNQFIATAVAEKLSTLETVDFFEERARRADMTAFWRTINRPGSEPPREGDELPDGYISIRKRPDRDEQSDA